MSNEKYDDSVNEEIKHTDRTGEDRPEKPIDGYKPVSGDANDPSAQRDRQGDSDQE